MGRCKRIGDDRQPPPIHESVENCGAAGWLRGGRSVRWQRPGDRPAATADSYARTKSDTGTNADPDPDTRSGAQSHAHRLPAGFGSHRLQHGGIPPV